MLAGRSTQSLERTVNEAARVEDELFRLEQKLLQPTTRKSAESVGALLADDFVEFGSSGGVYHRASVIAGLSQETPVRWVISNFKTVVLAEGVVLVTYRAMKGGGASSLRSSIWKLIDGRWRMAFHQGTPIPK